MKPTELVELSSRAREVFASEELDPWAGLAELGFFSNVVSRELGGRGAGLVPSTVVFEELAATGYAPMLAGFAALSAAAVARNGSEGLQRRLLEPLFEGRARVAIAATEERAGFNLFAIETSAQRVGDGYLLNGAKVYISGADACDYLLVVARSLGLDEIERRELPKTAGLSIFLVPRDLQGITTTPMATRGEGKERQYRVHFEGVELEPELRLGPEHKGIQVLFPTFNMERILFAAMTCGLSEFCLQRACEHARERRVWSGTPIGAYQAIQHPLAEVKIRQHAVRLMTREAAAAWDEDPASPSVARLANQAKYLGAELLNKAVDSAIDALGGCGFDEEVGVIQLLETARLLKLSPISNSLVLSEIAERVLKLPRSY